MELGKLTWVVKIRLKPSIEEHSYPHMRTTVTSVLNKHLYGHGEFGDPSLFFFPPFALVLLLIAHANPTHSM